MPPSYYPQSVITPNLGLSLYSVDEVVADNFIILDAFAGTAQSIQVNGAVIPQTNFVDSATVTFTVAGNNVTANAVGGGGSVDVNGVPIAAPNFNNAVPAAPGGATNVLWQVAGGSVSAYVIIPAAGTFPVTIAAVPSNWLNSYSSVTGLFSATQPTFSDLSSHPTTLAGYGITDAIAAGLMTTLGDTLYENVTPTPTRLAGNITVTKKYLSQTGTGAVSAAPVWAQINYADITGTAPVTSWSALTGTLSNGQVIPYGDIGISRLGAGSLAVGNGTAGDVSGDLTANRLNSELSVSKEVGFGAVSPAAVQMASDSFPYSNGDLHTANPNWVYNENTFTVSSNHVFDSHSGTSVAHRSDISPANNQYVLTTMVIGGIAGTQNCGPAVRISGSGATVSMYFVQCANNDLALGKLVSGVATTLIGNFGTVANGDVIGLFAVGTTLTVTQNGVVVGTVIDASLSSGAVGLFSGDAATNTLNGFSIWSAGNAYDVSDSTTVDTAFTRISAGNVGLGNGAQGDYTGTLTITKLAFPSSGNLFWNADTNISRLGAGSLAIGNGTAANTTGNLSLNRISKAGADFAGQATVTAGGTTKAVSFGANYAGTGQPVIILTPTSDPLALGVPVGYWVTYSGGAGAWTGFTVNIQTALAGDVVFNYIVIGVA